MISHSKEHQKPAQKQPFTNLKSKIKTITTIIRKIRKTIDNLNY